MKNTTPPTNNGHEPLAAPKTRFEKERWTLPTTQYEPLNVLRDIGPGVTAARPGAFDHEQHGSLQADGSTRPYRTNLTVMQSKVRNPAFNHKDK